MTKKLTNLLGVGLVAGAGLFSGCSSINVPNGYDPTIKTESQTREKSLSEKLKPYDPVLGFGAFLLSL